MFLEVCWNISDETALQTQEWALVVWGRARYLWVTEFPLNMDSDDNGLTFVGFTERWGDKSEVINAPD